MLVTMKNSGLIDKLVLIADGDIDLVSKAVRECARDTGGEADLKQVVDYIMAHRKPEPAVA